MSSLSVSNPHNGEKLHEIQLDGPDAVDEAYSRAVTAQQKWAERGPRERAAVIDSLLNTIENRREEIVSELVREAGSSEEKKQMQK
jgi:aldehyde dehydrogenase (NAD+)